MKKYHLSILFFFVVLSSCKTAQFLETENNGDIRELINQRYEPHILDTDDKITVSIWDHDDVSIGSAYSIYSVNEAFGKWVQIDSAGLVALPKVGRVKLGGLTCKGASDTLTNLYGAFLKEPIIVVKVLNKEVTVIGEVKAAGNYIIDKEYTTLSEIIGKAQGFTKYSKTKNVQFIRDSTSYIIDLSTMNELNAHSIIVRHGDIINIPATKGKAMDTKLSRIIPFTSAITAGAIVYSVIK